MIPLSPSEILESDRALARKDPRAKTKRLEQKINSAFRRWWFRIVLWAKRQEVKRKANSEAKQSKAWREYRKLTWEANRSEQ